MEAITQPNDAWILHREEIFTIKEGHCNVYLLLDAYSAFCFNQTLSVDLLSSSEITSLLKEAKSKTKNWPKQIYLAKNDPYVENLKEIGAILKLKIKTLPSKDLMPFTELLREAFHKFKTGNPKEMQPLSQTEKDELEAFIPDTYDPCPLCIKEKV